MKWLQTIKYKFYKYRPNYYNLSYNHFLNKNLSKFYAENGYVVINNIVTDDVIKIIKNAFSILRNHKSYYEVDGFITSANYGFEIQQQIHHELSAVNRVILPKIFDIENIYHNLLNVLVIKYNIDKKDFFAHQDIPLVEESEAPTTYAWIPTTDINEKNGALLVLPKSHKCFRWQRIHDQNNSPLREIRNNLLEYMIPIYLNKGDLILFDNSLIHASAPNITNEVRVAMNTGIAPKYSPLIHYQKIQKSKNKIEKYYVDEDFWQKGYYLNPNTVPEQYNPPIIEKLNFSGKITLDNFNEIIQQY